MHNFNYYFIKCTNTEVMPDRVPMRDFKIYNVDSSEKHYLYASNKAGNYELL